MTALLTLNTPSDSDLVRFFTFATRGLSNCKRYQVPVK